jgi:hypothetical protein
MFILPYERDISKHLVNTDHFHILVIRDGHHCKGKGLRTFVVPMERSVLAKI